ncbi:MAG: hypothetical protein IJS57_00725 [Paludibacteraceae bacterium]|nr:hypothetical protein [Paludibacteraceae bacterium]
MKKNYSKPTTETLEIRVENLMLNVSVNDSHGGGVAGAPRRGDRIPE